MTIPSDEKRQVIRQIATRLFVHQGFENTTTRDIAKEVGISNAALYYYFDSKEELLYQILDEIITTGLNNLKEIEKGSSSPKNKLAKILESYTRYYSIEPDKMRLLAHDQKSLAPEHRRDLIKKQRDYVHIVVSILDELKNRGEILDMNTTVCAFAFFGMVHWVYRWYDPDGEIKPLQLSDMFNRIFTRGIFREETDV